MILIRILKVLLRFNSMKIGLIALIFLSVQFSVGQNKTFTLKQVDSLTKDSQEISSSKKDFSIVEKIPVYKGCEHLKENRALKLCMSQKIQRHMDKIIFK